MNIAIVAPHLTPVPPFDGYGGTQRGIYDLSLGLARRNHHVFLIAPKGSAIDHSNVEVITPDKPVSKKDFLSFTEGVLFNLMQANKIEIINFRIQEEILISKFYDSGLPLVVSFHHHVDKLDRFLTNQAITVTVHSDMMRDSLSAYSNVVVIRYGIRMEHVDFYPAPMQPDRITLPEIKKIQENYSEYVLSLGRIEEIKGTSTALDIAIMADLPMIVAGEVIIRKEKNRYRKEKYFAENIMSKIDGQKYIYFGNANEQQKYELMGNAKAFILTSGIEKPFKETFGRVVAESMATGTPVIAYSDSGTASELFEDGKQGYLFDTPEQAVNQLAMIDQIDRAKVRQYAVDNLSDKNFIEESEKLFSRLISEYAE